MTCTGSPSAAANSWFPLVTTEHEKSRANARTDERPDRNRVLVIWRQTPSIRLDMTASRMGSNSPDCMASVAIDTPWSPTISAPPFPSRVSGLVDADIDEVASEQSHLRVRAGRK